MQNTDEINSCLGISLSLKNRSSFYTWVQNASFCACLLGSKASGINGKCYNSCGGWVATTTTKLSSSLSWLHFFASHPQSQFGKAHSTRPTSLATCCSWSFVVVVGSLSQRQDFRVPALESSSICEVQRIWSGGTKHLRIRNHTCELASTKSI